MSGQIERGGRRSRVQRHRSFESNGGLGNSIHAKFHVDISKKAIDKGHRETAEAFERSFVKATKTQPGDAR